MDVRERLLILADDFTGACDAAGAFGASRRTHVVSATPTAWPFDTDVLAVDLDVRERSVDAARASVAAAARRLSADCRIFLKIDSTLRGPIGGLVAGALLGSGKALAVVAPAFPEQGRLLIGGCLVVDGRVGPSLVDLLTEQGSLIVDADSTEPLRQLAEASRAHPEWLLVGSAGLARQLAGPGPNTYLPPPERFGPLLVVAGSPSPVSREQLRHLEGLAGVEILCTPPTDTRDLGEAATALAESVAEWGARNSPRAVVLTGGATARAVCQRLGVRALEVHGELEPGIPVATLRGGVWDGVTVVTKAGSFGTRKTLLDVAQALGVRSD